MGEGRGGEGHGEPMSKADIGLTKTDTIMPVGRAESDCVAQALEFAGIQYEKTCSGWNDWVRIYGGARVSQLVDFARAYAAIHASTVALKTDTSLAAGGFVCVSKDLVRRAASGICRTGEGGGG